MKLVLATCLLVFTLTASAQETPFTKAEFQQLVLKSFDDIFSAVRVEKIADYYTEDMLILEDGIVWNKDSVVQAINKRINSGRKINRINSIAAIQFDRDGNTAWGSYHNEATVAVDGGPERKIKWLESAVLVKQPNGWRIKLLHSTRIK